MSIAFVLVPIGSVVVPFLAFAEERLRWKAVALGFYAASWIIPLLVATDMPVMFIMQALLFISLLIYFKYLYL